MVAEARPFLVELQDGLTDCRTGIDPGAQIERLTEFAKGVIERNYDDAAVRMADIAQLRDIASSYSDRRRFLAEVTLGVGQTGHSAVHPIEHESHDCCPAGCGEIAVNGRDDRVEACEERARGQQIW